MDADRDQKRWDAVEEATELLVEGERKKALELLRAAVEADANNHYAYHYLGAVLYELDQHEAARDAYQAAVTLAPKYLVARVGLSHARRRLGDAKGAVQASSAALKLFPDDSDAHFAAALATAAAGDRPKAREHLQRFLELGPELEAQMEAQGLFDALKQGADDEPFDVK
jgi:tetratricopeptide (TPR) repeat protein